MKMKSLYLLVVLSSAVFNTGCIGCERIEAGNVGIEIKLAGMTTGVQQTPRVSGWNFYNTLTTDILQYPVFIQPAKWEGEEAISFNSQEGLAITAAVSMAYILTDSKVPSFYLKFRSDNLEAFTHGYLRNVVRDAFAEVAGNYPVEELYGPSKEKFLVEVKRKVVGGLGDIGVTVDQLGFIGNPKLPDSVVSRINAKIAATQQAIQVENELRTATAEAAKKVAQATGEADSAVKTAEGAAKARVARADGEAKANLALAKSLTPELMKWRETELTAAAISRWNGAYPMVSGGGQGMILQIPQLGAKP